MYHYNPETALEELTEDGTLPNPLYVRDMLIRAGLEPARAVELTRQFHDYQQAFTDAQTVAQRILDELVNVHKRP